MWDVLICALSASQRTISSTQSAPTAEEAEKIVAGAYSRIADNEKQNYEIAFFG
jgi:hypothetical protein